MDCYLSYLKGHNGDVNSLSICDTYLASGSSDGTIRIWDTSTEKSVRRLTDPGFFPSSPIENVCLYDYTLSASSGSSLYFFDIRNPSRIIIQESLGSLGFPDDHYPNLHEIRTDRFFPGQRCDFSDELPVQRASGLPGFPRKCK